MSLEGYISKGRRCVSMRVVGSMEELCEMRKLKVGSESSTLVCAWPNAAGVFGFHFWFIFARQ